MSDHIINYLHFYRYFVALHVVINGFSCCVYTHNIRYLSLKNTIVVVLSVPPAFAGPLFDWRLTFSNHTEKSIAMPYFDKILGVLVGFISLELIQVYFIIEQNDV